MMGTGSGVGGFGMGLGLLFWISIILLFYYVLVERERKKPSKRETPALEILKRRYAKGELTREEFLQMKEEM